MNAKVNSRLFSNIITNLLCLGTTFLCMVLVQVTFSIQALPADHQALLILGIVIFGSAAISDVILAQETKVSFFSFITFFLISISIVLTFISQTKLATNFQPSSLMALLFTFISFRCIGLLLLTPWDYPRFLCTNVMIFGDHTHAKTIHGLIDQSRGRFALKDSFISVDNSNDYSSDRYRQLNEDEENMLYLQARKAGVDILVASFPERRGFMPVQQMLKCRMLGMKIVEVQTFYEFISRKLYIENLKPSDLIFSNGFSLSLRKRFIKRVTDIICSIIGLALFAPFFPIIALLLYLDSPGPIFFRQIRTGRDNKLFHIIKFRTMRNDAEKATGAVWATKEDPRITKFGSFLRKSRIDEIPQLINILQGEMSLIGPRPERPEFISDLKKSIPFYSERHHVKPGVTGWAQVCYPYGASVEDALEKLRYDLYYIKNQSFLLDIEIVLRTIIIVFTRNGAR